MCGCQLTPEMAGERWRAPCNRPAKRGDSWALRGARRPRSMDRVQEAPMRAARWPSGARSLDQKTEAHVAMSARRIMAPRPRARELAGHCGAINRALTAVATPSHVPGAVWRRAAGVAGAWKVDGARSAGSLLVCCGARGLKREQTRAVFLYKRLIYWYAFSYQRFSCAKRRAQQRRRESRG